MKRQSCERVQVFWAACRLDRYTILPLPILCGLYCDEGGSAGNNIVRNNVGDEGGSGVPKQRGYVQRIVLIRAQKTLSERISCNGQVQAR